MKHPAKCKFCGKVLLLTMDDSYDAIGDPLKLLPLAACNRCADLRVRRRKLEEAIDRAVLPMLQNARQSEEQQAKTREALVELTKKYTALVADWMGSNAPWWDKEIVDSIMDQPQHYSKFLGQCWKMYEDKPTEVPQ